uniref:Transmembrane protein 159 n=1 Tax=Amphilophus citrinellus TaxID=61819 RepID=A0A3Q0T4W0_AMPCI
MNTILFDTGQTPKTFCSPATSCWTNTPVRLQREVNKVRKRARLMNTRIGQYLSNHSFVALSVLMFSAMAAVPVGLFLTFAVVTTMMSAVVFLLFVGGLALLWVLSGIALFAVVASAIVNFMYITIFGLLNRYYPHLTKVMYG